MTFFDLHVTYGLVAALEPIMRSYRMMPAEALRMALLGLHESMSAERALRSGLVTAIVAAGVLTSARLRDRGGDRIATDRRRAGHRQGALAVPRPGRYQALASALMFTQSGNPIGTADIDRPL